MGLQSLRYSLMNFFRFIKKPYSQAGKDDIRRYGSSLHEQNYAPRSIERYLAVWKNSIIIVSITFCFWIIRRNLVLSRIPPSLPNVLTQAQALKLLDQPNILTLLGSRDKALLETLYATGIRLNEAVNLNVDDVDLTAGFLRVNLGKGAKDRGIALDQICLRRVKRVSG